MKIGIDANTWVSEKAGIGSYTRNIIVSLLEIDQKNEYILFFNIRSDFENKKAEVEKRLAKYPNAKIKFRKIPGKAKDILLDRGFPAPLFFGQKVDIFFAPYFSSIGHRGYKKQVSCICDLSFYHFDNLASNKQVNFWKRCCARAIKESEKIVTISESTKRDIIKLFPSVDPNDIVVTYLGVDHQKYKPVDKKTGFRGHDNYILSVCSFEPRKNLEKLVRAYSRLEMTVQEKYPLILTGEIRWGVADLLEKIKANGNIITTGYLSEEEKILAYQNASVFVYPSIYEGFGLPPLEAMACGIPTIIGRNSSLPEVGGQATIFVDEKSTADLTNKLQETIDLPLDKLEEIKNKSIAQAEKFSWQKSAKELLECFNEI